MKVKYYRGIDAYAVTVIEGFRNRISVYCDSYKYDEDMKWLTLMMDNNIICSLWDDDADNAYKLLEEIEV